MKEQLSKELNLFLTHPHEGSLTMYVTREQQGSISLSFGVDERSAGDERDIRREWLEPGGELKLGRCLLATTALEQCLAEPDPRSSAARLVSDLPLEGVDLLLKRRFSVELHIRIIMTFYHNYQSRLVDVLESGKLIVERSRADGHDDDRADNEPPGGDDRNDRLPSWRTVGLA